MVLGDAWRRTAPSRAARTARTAQKVPCGRLHQRLDSTPRERERGALPQHLGHSTMRVAQQEEARAAGIGAPGSALLVHSAQAACCARARVALRSLALARQHACAAQQATTLHWRELQPAQAARAASSRRARERMAVPGARRESTHRGRRSRGAGQKAAQAARRGGFDRGRKRRQRRRGW